MIIRDAIAADLPDLRELYNALIYTTTIAWTESNETLRQRQTWFRSQQRNSYPVLVAEVHGIVGSVRTAASAVAVDGLVIDTPSNRQSTSNDPIGEVASHERYSPNSSVGRAPRGFTSWSPQLTAISLRQFGFTSVAATPVVR